MAEHDQHAKRVKSWASHSRPVVKGRPWLTRIENRCTKNSKKERSRLIARRIRIRIRKKIRIKIVMTNKRSIKKRRKRRRKTSRSGSFFVLFNDDVAENIYATLFIVFG